MLLRFLRNQKGFTMIEMMVVLIIIGVLIAGGIYVYLGYIDRAKVSKAAGEMAPMAAALDAYYAEEGDYPASESDAITKAGLPDDPKETNTQLPKDPWGVKYVYTYTAASSTTPAKFTLKAIDGNNTERVVFEGTGGTSERTK
ncbi:MAG: type II secretion system protein GspG [Syntrophothermus sp.]|uniref:type II secretion system protein n=1 Tax=Syntrophothermus sp. TaxID=2736299 RepID=UPI00258041BA|nr:prepilin-type N-terminal cleavage/methylation domain-containing protein [Syntrophothermus sp.]NSW84204.1 type II secretion system protein GspG [Syntrophothermus sp.]